MRETSQEVMMDRKPETNPENPSEKKTPSKIVSAGASVVGVTIGVIIGVAVSRMLPLKVIFVLLGGAIAGGGVGLIPFFVAKKRDRLKLGKIALLSCIGSGLALGILLAGPVALVFTLVILLKTEDAND